MMFELRNGENKISLAKHFLFHPLVDQTNDLYYLYFLQTVNATVCTVIQITKLLVDMVDWTGYFKNNTHYNYIYF